MTPDALAERRHERQNALMTVWITIRGVPEDVRDELASRAALNSPW